VFHRWNGDENLAGQLKFYSWELAVKFAGGNTESRYENEQSMEKVSTRKGRFGHDWTQHGIKSPNELLRTTYS